MLTTPNFLVHAPAWLASEVAEVAEYERGKIAMRWLGREIPTWEVPCLVVVIDHEKPWGWFYHHNGDARSIIIHGGRDTVFNHTLPHELTHVVMASYFKVHMLPRWCDEGMAMISEHDCPARLKGHCGKLPLIELFETVEYPANWEPFYGQCYAVTKYIVDRFGCDRFLSFIRQGPKWGWNEAAKCILKTTVDELNVSWHSTTDKT